MAPHPPAGPPRPLPEATPAGVPAGLGLSHGYSEIKPIGKGSYGVATLVQDREGNLFVMKAVAMSRLDHKQQDDAVNEVKVLASLKHPYIVRYRESFLEKGTLAIVMDYAAGGDLLQRIRQAKAKQQAFPEPQILTWMAQVTLGLKYLHSKQIIHRDLKSPNLFLSDRGQLRIGDFGISKMLRRTVLVGDCAIGTPYYLSPEICTDSLYSCASDMWALGCVLYEIAVLKVPFEAPNFQALVDRITEGPTPNLPYSFSADLRVLGRDLLCRDPRRRPLSTDVLKRSFVQKEISRMLREAQESAPPSKTGTLSSIRSDDDSSMGTQLQGTQAQVRLLPAPSVQKDRPTSRAAPGGPDAPEILPLGTLLRPSSKAGLHETLMRNAQRVAQALDAEVPPLGALLRPPSLGALVDASARASPSAMRGLRPNSVPVPRLEQPRQHPRHHDVLGGQAGRVGTGTRPRTSSEADLSASGCGGGGGPVLAETAGDRKASKESVSGCLRTSPKAFLKPLQRDGLCMTRSPSRHHRIRLCRDLPGFHDAR